MKKINGFQNYLDQTYVEQYLEPQKKEEKEQVVKLKVVVKGTTIKNKNGIEVVDIAIDSNSKVYKIGQELTVWETPKAKTHYVVKLNSNDMDIIPKDSVEKVS